MAEGIDARLEEVAARHAQVQDEMASPRAASDPGRMRELGKAFAELDEIVRPYQAYRSVVRQAEEARELAAAESDPEMVAYLREEAERLEAEATELRGQLEL